MQDKEENWWLLKRLEENISEFDNPINTILEIGVADGGGAKIWEQVLLSQLKNGQNPKDLLYIGIDYSPNILWNYKNSPIDIRLIANDTHKLETIQYLKQILKEKGNRKVDFLFIDAQHHSRDVEMDFVNFGGFVKENCIIGFHDTRLCRSFWDKFTGGCIDGDNVNGVCNAQENMIFHKEEFKVSLGTGLFYNIPNQNVIQYIRYL